MVPLLDTTEFESLFLSDEILIDVRSPGEFEHARLPNSSNSPLLTNGERAVVGTEFRHHGQAKAIELGHQLVNGQVKAERIDSWLALIREQNVRALFCARGGLRSEIAQRWLREAGVSLPRVEGGYKALRRSLMDSFSSFIQDAHILVVSGQTGTGKTRFLLDGSHRCEAIDLEGLAMHCGSSFGGLFGVQPTQATFENSLFVRAIKAQHSTQASRRMILIEDESRKIGQLSLPKALFQRITDAPRVVLELPMEQRIDIIKQDYVVNIIARRAPSERTAAFDGLQTSLMSALKRLTKRLGDQRTKKALSLVVEAIAAHRDREDLSLHDAWIELLLREYYDPSYSRQLDARGQTIIGRGTVADLLQQPHLFQS